MSKQVAHLVQFRKQAERTLEWYEIEDKLKLLAPVDERLRLLKSDLNQYAECQQVEPAFSLNEIKNISQTLVHTRLWLGWTQAKLGLRAGIGAKTINNYERKGYLRANLQSIFSIAEALDQGIFEKAEAEKRWHGKPKLFSDDDLKSRPKVTLAYDEDAEYLIEDGRLVEPPYEPDDEDDFGFGI